MAAKAGLKKLQEKLQAAHKRASTMNRKAKESRTVEPLAQGFVGGAYGYVLGRSENGLPTVAGLPPALLYGGLSLIVAAFTRGKQQELASGAAGALLAVGAAQKGLQMGADAKMQAAKEARGAAPTRGISDGNVIGFEDLNTQTSNNTSL